jgi:hypothetical protein
LKTLGDVAIPQVYREGFVADAVSGALNNVLVGETERELGIRERREGNSKDEDRWEDAAGGVASAGAKELGHGLILRTLPDTLCKSLLIKKVKRNPSQ